ncbi:MAG: LiaI-LiaF-like domain-containing protein, partial [Bryobacteraceae bacterium]
MDFDPRENHREFGKRLRDQIRADVYMRYRHHHHCGMGGLAIGLIIAGVGVLLLLQNLGIFYIWDVWRYWPVILIAFGVSRAASAFTMGRRIEGAIEALAGIVFLLANLRLLPWNFWQFFWPVVLIAFGLMILVRTLDR